MTPEEKRVRNALAQARYRKRNASRIAAARRLAHLLLHHDDDVEAIADALRGALSEDHLHDLCKTLTPRSRKRRR
jgi:hypothetical protein